jgi:leucyl-tRNA synthetase
MSRFLYRVWELQDKVAADAPANEAAEHLLHQTIKQVGERIEAMKFNTAIASLMTLANQFGSQERIRKDHWQTFLTLLAPFAPHICEELWQTLGHGRSLAYEPWPRFDPAMLREDEIEIPVQVNGKLRSKVRVPASADHEKVQEIALADERTQSSLAGKPVKKVIIVPGRMVNIVTG